MFARGQEQQRRQHSPREFRVLQLNFKYITSHNFILLIRNQQNEMYFQLP